MIEKIDNKPDEYGKNCMKIKLNPDDDLPFHEQLNFNDHC